MGKIVSQSRAVEIRDRCRRLRRKVVFTNGCFDIIHRGHIEYLAKAKKLGDLLIVGLNGDNSVRKLKGKGRPVIRQQDRAFILSHLDMVDYVVMFDTLTPKRLIKKIAPDILVKGGDYDPRTIVGADEVKAFGGKVITLPYIPGRSTSAIINRVRSAT